MPKILIITLFIILQSCRTTQKVKIPLKYPVNVHFSSVCCGTTNPEPICIFLTEFLKKNKINKILILDQRFMIGEGSYTLHFHLNNFNRSQKESFIAELGSVVKNMKPVNESDGLVAISNKTPFSFNKRIRRTGTWALTNYDSTMKCIDWFKSTPIAGSIR